MKASCREPPVEPSRGPTGPAAPASCAPLTRSLQPACREGGGQSTDGQAGERLSSIRPRAMGGGASARNGCSCRSCLLRCYEPEAIACVAQASKGQRVVWSVRVLVLPGGTTPQPPGRELRRRARPRRCGPCGPCGPCTHRSPCQGWRDPVTARAAAPASRQQAAAQALAAALAPPPLEHHHHHHRHPTCSLPWSTSCMSGLSSTAPMQYQPSVSWMRMDSREAG